MLRALCAALNVVVLVAPLAGCAFDDLTFDFQLDFSPVPEDRVPGRLALGTTAVAVLYTRDPDSTTHAVNSRVLEVVRIDDTRVQLTAVGVGRTTLIFTERGQSVPFPIEVASHEGYEVIFVESDFRGPVPIGPLRGRVLLAGVPQEFVVRYFDSEGPLSGNGLAEVVLPVAGRPCESTIDGSLDAYCIVLGRGLHGVDVEVQGDRRRIALRAESEEEISDVRLRSLWQRDARGQVLIRVDAVGISSSGNDVYGIRANYVAPHAWNGGYFLYEPMRDEPEAVMDAVALGVTRGLSFRGVAEPPPVLPEACKSTLLSTCEPSSQEPGEL